MVNTQKLTLSVDKKLLKKFRKYYKGSISSLLNGVMVTILHYSENEK